MDSSDISTHEAVTCVDISKLLYVMTVADTNNLADAAEKLGVPRPAVSNSIKSLEHELGLKVFATIHVQFIPTTVGVDFINHAQTIISEYNILASEFLPRMSAQSKQGGSKQGRVTLAVSSEASYGIIEKMYSDYYLNSNIIINIDITDTLHIYEDIDNLFYDCALILSCKETVRRYDSLALSTAQPVIGIPNSSPLSSKHTLTAVDLNELNLVTCGHRSELCRKLLSACAGEGSSPNVIFSVNDFVKAKQVATNLDASYVSISSPLQQAPYNYTEVPIHLPGLESLGTYAIRSQSKNISPSALHFWKALSKYRESNMIKKYMPTT